MPGFNGQPPIYQQGHGPAQNAYGQIPYQQQGPNQPLYVQTAYQVQPYLQQTPGGPRSSGYRLSSGIIGVVLGAWLFLSFVVGVSLQQGAVLLMTLIACFGSIAAGIVLLVQQRGRGRAAPVVMICVAGVALLFSFGSFGQFFFTFLLTTPIFIVMGIGLAREAKGL